VNVAFPSYQFSTGAYLALDGAIVAELDNATTTFVIDHVGLGLQAGAHTLTAVVDGQVTSSFSFYVVPAPSWISSIRSSSQATLYPGKGFKVHSAFPLNNIVPVLDMEGFTTLTPTITGTVDFAYPLNGLLSSAFAASSSFDPTYPSNHSFRLLLPHNTLDLLTCF
jgi:hypothetical protein